MQTNPLSIAGIRPAPCPDRRHPCRVEGATDGGSHPIKKKAVSTKKNALAKAKPDGLSPLIAEVRNLIQSARHAAATTVNTLQVLTNFEIGRRIVEHEQRGEKRAVYGAGLLKELSIRLTSEFGRGFSEDNLSNMRRFFLTWRDRVAEFPHSLFGNSVAQIGQQPAGALPISAQPMRKSPFTLSWTHYLVLLSIKAPD